MTVGRASRSSKSANVYRLSHHQGIAGQACTYQALKDKATTPTDPNRIRSRRPSSVAVNLRSQAIFYFVDLGEKRFCEFGNGSHIPHDFAFFFISHFMPGKQHNRRFPEASMSHAFSIRRLRVPDCLAELIEKIQSRRAIGVMSSHPACASGADVRALRRSIGTLISGSSPVRVISTVTVPKPSAPAASRMVLFTLSQ